MFGGRVLRARLLAWLLWAMAIPLLGVTIASIWGNMWVAWSSNAVGVFHGQLYIRWGFTNPTFQILSPGVHARWLDADWDWYRTWHQNLSAFRSINVPLVVPVILILLGAAWATAFYRTIRGAGHCRRCGYDLAGLGTRTTCPECGRAFANQSRAA